MELVFTTKMLWFWSTIQLLLPIRFLKSPARRAVRGVSLAVISDGKVRRSGTDTSGCGLLAEGAAAADRKALLSQALNEYLSVVYAGPTEEWWVKKAAWQALPLIGQAHQRRAVGGMLRVE